MSIPGCALLWLLSAAPQTPADVPEPLRREIVRTLEGLEREWFGVYVTRDVSPLERLIADDFVATLADGAMRGKREHIAAYATDFESVATVTNSELQVRIFARDAAVATGLYTATLKGASGSGAVERYRYTDTWVLRRGAWQCVATHESHVGEGEPE